MHSRWSVSLSTEQARVAREDNGRDATSIHGDEVWGTNTHAQPVTFRTSSSKSITHWSCHSCVPQEADPEGDIRMQEMYLELTPVGQALWALAPVGDQGLKSVLLLLCQSGPRVSNQR